MLYNVPINRQAHYAARFVTGGIRYINGTTQGHVMNDTDKQFYLDQYHSNGCICENVKDCNSVLCNQCWRLLPSRLRLWFKWYQRHGTDPAIEAKLCSAKWTKWACRYETAVQFLVTYTDRIKFL